MWPWVLVVWALITAFYGAAQWCGNRLHGEDGLCGAPVWWIMLTWPIWVGVIAWDIGWGPHYPRNRKEPT